jgi:hypothetical protein
MSEDFYFIVYEEESEDFCLVVRKSKSLDKIKDYKKLIEQAGFAIHGIIKGKIISDSCIDTLSSKDFEILERHIEYKKEYIERLKRVYAKIREEERNAENKSK